MLSILFKRERQSSSFCLSDISSHNYTWKETENSQSILPVKIVFVAYLHHHSLLLNLGHAIQINGLSGFLESFISGECLLTPCASGNMLLVVPVEVGKCQTLASILSPIFQFYLPKATTANIFGREKCSQSLYIVYSSIIILLNSCI